ncbi:MAG: PBP1A family penicillin-binding protein [Acidobacteria bacterium]|nr:PBP1A family penicillin-binding protein [Acidobacteriota bacterium]MBU1474425.1 PBP1A family penicillin-binding protein [Acidobacteriota bacterium]
MEFRVAFFSDNDIRGGILSQTLSRAGIEAEWHKSPLETRRAVERQRYSLVILDVDPRLPSALTLVEALAADFPETQLIVLTVAFTSSDIKSFLLRQGNCIHLSGPLDPDLLLELISEKKRDLDEESRRGTVLLALKQSLKWSRRAFRVAFPITIAVFFGALIGYVYWCFATLPDLSLLEEYSPYQSSKLYSQESRLLREFYLERRTFVPAEDIPEKVKNALIAVEDNNYYTHPGIDVVRTLSALFRNIHAGAFVQGGSTITQQLAKMIFLEPRKTITRKIQEMIIALKIERRYSKDEILGLYLNQTYFGTRAYGIEAASQIYFGKPVEEISTAEAALLAALPKSPQNYSPYIRPDWSLSRRDHVLRRMRDKGFIGPDEYGEALNVDIPQKISGARFDSPYFVEYARSILKERFGDRLYVSGLKIFSSLNYDMQLHAEEAVRAGIEALNQRGWPGVQVALVAVEMKTGKIRAMVGGSNFWESQFNRATQAHRQPGSSFKPIVFLTALNMGYRPDDLITDTLKTYQSGGVSWTPKNYGNSYRGDVTLETAFALSLNAATLDLARRVKLKNIIRTAEDLGIRSPVRPFYPSTIGASEVTLLEMVYAYLALATGDRFEPACIDKIIDPEKNILLEPKIEKETVINPLVLRRIRHLLRASVSDGTARKAEVLDRPVFGKTGTSNDYADAWFIGFDDTLVVGVWVGRDKRIPIGDEETGSTAALPIWVEFMKNF